MKPTYTRLAADLSLWTGDPTEHPLVQVEHPLLARPIIVTAIKAPEATRDQQRKWAETLQLGGHAFRLWEVQEAVLCFDYTSSDDLRLPTEFFPDSESEWMWTNTPDNTPPAGYGRVVLLDDGLVSIHLESNRYSARAVLVGQSV